MRSNHSGNTILGTIHHGQGIAVEGTHRSTLRVLIAKFTRRLSLRLGGWRALKRMSTTMTPAMAAHHVRVQNVWSAAEATTP